MTVSPETANTPPPYSCQVVLTPNSFGVTSIGNLSNRLSTQHAITHPPQFGRDSSTIKRPWPSTAGAWKLRIRHLP
ncbi:unnamed protein product [Linum tenue]|uniref:Uncharacterized protein n=1 Tax=Linum tenue TaxID=586396 RepID=A0AAV0P2Z6_9ROSI|nr:unnamed protein product [Linum tenue]